MTSKQNQARSVLPDLFYLFPIKSVAVIKWHANSRKEMFWNPYQVPARVCVTEMTFTVPSECQFLCEIRDMEYLAIKKRVFQLAHDDNSIMSCHNSCLSSPNLLSITQYWLVHLRLVFVVVCFELYPDRNDHFAISIHRDRCHMSWRTMTHANVWMEPSFSQTPSNERWICYMKLIFGK